MEGNSLEIFFKFIINFNKRILSRFWLKLLFDLLDPITKLILTKNQVSELDY